MVYGWTYRLFSFYKHLILQTKSKCSKGLIYVISSYQPIKGSKNDMLWTMDKLNILR